MFRLSRLTDYGFVLLTRIAAQPGRQFNARDLSVESALPLPTVSKLLKKLARAGLLTSARGVAGGYTLAKPPETIKVSDILAALEGPIALTMCSEADGKCSLQACCPTHSNWLVINSAVKGVLDTLTLASLVKPLPQKILTLNIRHSTQPAPAGSSSS